MKAKLVLFIVVIMTHVVPISQRRLLARISQHATQGLLLKRTTTKLAVALNQLVRQLSGAAHSQQTRLALLHIEQKIMQ